MRLSRKLGIILAVGLVTGCSTAVDKTQAGFGDAAMAPLTDLNLRRTEVPVLLDQIRSPYEPVPEVSCEAISRAVASLTAILGQDVDAPPRPDPSWEDQAGSGAAGMTLNAVSSTMTDFIPFRSIVREATGASAHDRKLRAAYERGVTRRAYLKGVGAQLGCAPPAAPEPNAGIPQAGAQIEYRSKVQPD
ncbi:MAG: hypothetical protein EON94_15205 [Caulobacteraceae bacterium]|nr:MAG: hypothetical protein EON94_15205 [Caulobacteraceae bacterium]